MNTTTNSLVQKLWNYCNVLRDDGMSYGDYVEQLTYLLFLKMADERSAPPYNQASIVPAAYAWPTLLAKDGDELFDHYRHLLEKPYRDKLQLALEEHFGRRLRVEYARRSRVVPLVAGDAVDNVEQQLAQPVACVLVALEGVVQ